MTLRPNLYSLSATLLVSGVAATLLFACEGSTSDEAASGGSSAGGSSAGGSSAGGSSANGSAVLCGLSHSEFNDDESVQAMSEAAWTCDETTRFLVANGIPDHEVGTFPNPANPNTISAQTVDVSFPLFPALESETGTPTQVVAYALNGVKFEVGTAGTCDDGGDCNAIGNGGQWRMEAVGENSFDFGNDESNGHVQPFGAYHYHGIPEAYLTKLGKGQAMTLVGWAVDGFPIYARYGLSDPLDATSAVAIMRGSYVQKAQPDAGRPDVSVYPMGAFTQDYEYSAGSGDLDECNGREGVTPEFPEGTYHYYLTDSFPFGQRCVKGEAPADTGMMPPPGGGPGGGPPPGG